MTQGVEKFAATARSTVDRVVAETLYLVLGTADEDGRPWVSPVFFAPLGGERIVWVSSPDARHSRNIARRDSVALTVFDSTVEVGHAEAAYFDARAAEAAGDEVQSALTALNSRLPSGKQLDIGDIDPQGPMVVYVAVVDRRYGLVRGGNRELKNVLDMTVEL